MSAKREEAVRWLHEAMRYQDGGWHPSVYGPHRDLYFIASESYGGGVEGDVVDGAKLDALYARAHAEAEEGDYEDAQEAFCDLYFGTDLTPDDDGGEAT